MAKRIMRLVYKRIVPSREVKIKAGLLGEAVNIKKYKIITDSIILQDPKMIDVERYIITEENKPLQISPKPWISYCRWHSGPLNRPDEPWTRIYCNIPSDSYCRQHKRTPRHIYELCVTLHGDRGLAACKELDKIEKTDYIVYLTDFGGDRPKVGMTRRFRFLERLAEQTHITATVIFESDSAFEARKTELKISRLGLAQEAKRQKLRRTRSLGESALRLRNWAERIARELDLVWESKILSIEPGTDLNLYKLIRDPSSIGEPFQIRDYWGGFLLVETKSSLIAINSRQLQHKDSIVYSTDY